MTVGERIKYVREQLGMSQDDLAEKMGYSTRQAISKAERHGDNITTTKVQKYANALGVTFAYLMGWESVSDPATMAMEQIIQYNNEHGGQSKMAELNYNATVKKPAATSDKLHLNMISSIDIPTTSNVITDDEYNLILQYRNADDKVKDMIVQLLSYAVSKED